MQATRTRLSVSPDWLSPLLLCAATCLIGLLALRELRVAPQAFASAGAAASAVTTTVTVPPDAVSIPTLVVGASELGVGDLASDAIRRLSAAATLAGTADERGPLGVRETRAYRLDGSSVIVVLEPFERRGPLRVAAIYLH
jgi:hypothetical protein